MTKSSLIMIFSFYDPEKGQLCQEAGWGKIRRQSLGYNYIELMNTKKNEPNNTYKILNQNEVTEFCVEIGNIKHCRNNYLVHNLNQSGVTSISDIKPKVQEKTGLVYKG